MKNSLRKYRKKHKMKAEEAAEKVEISLGTLYAYERGTRPIPSDKLKLFADVYGTTVDALLEPSMDEEE